MPLTINRKAPAVCPSDTSYRKIMGLDISTKTGVAILAAHAGGVQIEALEKIAFDPKHGKDLQRFKRWDKYARAFRQLLLGHQPDVCYVEGYGFAQKGAAITLIEIGTVLRRELEDCNIPWVEVPPTVLKKFVTGKGNADKNVMLKEAFKRFALDTSDDDLCDAACLGYLGAAAMEYPLNLPAAQLAEAKKYPLQLTAKTC